MSLNTLHFYLIMWQMPHVIDKKAKIQNLKLSVHYLLISKLALLETMQGDFRERNLEKQQGEDCGITNLTNVLNCHTQYVNCTPVVLYDDTVFSLFPFKHFRQVWTVSFPMKLGSRTVAASQYSNVVSSLCPYFLFLRFERNEVMQYCQHSIWWLKATEYGHEISFIQW